VVDQEDLNARARAGAFIGTLQAGYTDFHYLRPIWKQTTEEDALIGVGMTGIGSGAVLGLDLAEAAEVVKEENRSVAFLIDINPAARTTTVKPAGTSSLVLGSASGVHAWHNDYYIRRIRVGKNEAIYRYLAEHHPELVKDEHFRPAEQAVIEIPQRAPAGAILRHESPEELLARVKRFNLEWVRAGHRDGANSHNVSCTISVKDDEWARVGAWMWENRDHYNGISVLPYDGGSYIQAPFEDIDADTYNKLIGTLSAVDLTRVVEIEDNTDLTGELACGAGGCELK
jgi:ribonucleoside-diphosphate reductase alpha chain